MIPLKSDTLDASPHDAGHLRGRLAGRLQRLGSLVFGLNRQTLVVPHTLLAQLETGEIREQMAAIRRELPIRIVAIVVTASICLFYVPPGLVLAAVLVTLAADRAEGLLFRKVIEEPGKTFYRRAAIAAVYVGEIGFCLPAALVWHVEDAFSKSISVGVFAAAMMRLATTRSIFPVTGFAGLAALLSIMAVVNSYYWLHAGNYGGFAITSAIALTSVGYVAASISQNHQQMRLSAVSRLRAEAASQAKSHFLAQMSHELRTPLNAIIGLGVAARGEATTEAGRDQLSILVTSARTLATLLDDALDTAAIAENRIALRPRAGALREELGLAVSLFQCEAALSGTELRIVFDAALPTAMKIDYDRLRQCVSNLLSNALRHSTGGKIEVSVAVLREGWLQITVADDGVGLPAGVEARMSALPRDDAPDLRRHGLGLSICQSIVRQMGGEIRALPATTGARLQIDLPGEVVDAASLGPNPANAQPGALGLRALVVDDVATNRLVAATYLRMLACEPVEASSGREAIAVMQRDAEIRLILLDMNMPEMSGEETFAELVALNLAGQSCPVIAITADSAEHDRLRYLGLGIDGYVSKPIHLPTLEAEIRRVMATAV